MKTLFTVILSCTIMLSAMAQSSMVVNKSAKKHHKMEFWDGFMPKTHAQQFDFKTKYKQHLRSTSSATQKMDSIIAVEWDSTTSQWENYRKHEYTYDSNGNNIVYIYSKWDSTTSQWENFYKREYTYDANGTRTSFISSLWNSTTTQWENYGKDEYTYDANGNMTFYLESSWESTSSQWRNMWKREYTYDANGNMTSYIRSHWNRTTSQWENSDKVEYTYDANGNESIEIYSQWNSDSSQWENSDKYEYTYDANGKMTVYIYSEWNSTTSQWENSWKGELTYDANGNNTVEIDSKWNSTTSQWENSYKYENTYDLGYLADDLILPDYLYYDFSVSVNKLTGYTEYDYDGTTWVNKEERTFYYSDVSATSVPEVDNNAYTVYPNPASESVTFEIPEPSINTTVDIFTIHGKKILSQRLNNHTVDVSNMSKGIYLYQLNIDNKIYNGKLIIK